jgi:ribosomal-protein-alanine N-acetyltransferase
MVEFSGISVAQGSSMFLQTDRFIAKLPTLADLDHWTNLLLDPKVMTYIHKKPTNAADVRKMYLDKSMDHATKTGYSSCSIFDKYTGEFVGLAGIFRYNFDFTQPDIEIGCFLHQTYWRAGCARELARSFVDWGFKHIGTARLIADANPLNENSWGAMRKFGMRYVGEVMVKDHEMVLYEVCRK